MKLFYRYSRYFTLLSLLLIAGCTNIRLITPAQNAVVPLLNAAQKAYLDLPRSERLAFFATPAKRQKLVETAGYYPLSVKFSWPEPNITTLRLSEQADLSNPIEHKVCGQSFTLDNLKIATKYYWQLVAIDQTVSPIASFVTEARAPRLLRAEKIPNVRDLGGRLGLNNRRIKQNLIIRTAGLNDNAHPRYAQDTAALFAERPELKTYYQDLEHKLAAIKAGKFQINIVPYSWSHDWIAFRPQIAKLTDQHNTKLAQLTAIPQTLFDANAEAATQNAQGRFEFAEMREFAVAVFMQEFTAEADGYMQVACGADWYWDLRINGVKVFDQLFGNAKKVAADNHVFYIPVKKGRNLAVATVLSGTAGWAWCCTSPPPQDPVKLLEAALAKLQKTPLGYLAGETRVHKQGKKFLVDTLHLKTDLDLRSPYECKFMTGSPLGDSVNWVQSSSAAYNAMQTDWGKAAFVKDFRLFLDRQNYPIVFHCIAGQDRTGSLAFVLNSLLGVSEEELYLDLDWEATGFWNADPAFKHRKRFNRLLDGFKAFPGDNW